MTDADKKPFLQAFSRLCVSLREKEPSAAQLRVYFAAMQKLDLELVLMAAGELEKTAKFFPKTSEWIAAAEHIERQRLEQQRLAIQGRAKAGLPPLCLDCDDTGWRRPPVTGGPEAVRKCECRQMRRLEILGRRPMPELPAPGKVDMPQQVDQAIAMLAEAKAMPRAGVYLQTEPDAGQ